MTGDEVPAFNFIGCGIPTVDAMGGALIGGYDVVFGAEGAGKTTMIARRIATAQKRFPDRVVLLAAPENRTVGVWLAAQGVDLSKLLVLDDKCFDGRATMEQYFDAMIAIIDEGNISYAPIDSISAMVPKDVVMNSKEQQRSVEDNQVAADAKKIQQWIKMSKATVYQHQTACTIIAQVRTKGIGGAMTWEDFSGGHMLRHMATQIWRAKRVGGESKEFEKVKIDGHDVNVLKAFETEWTLVKDTGPNEGRKAFVKFVAGVGFDDFECHIRGAIRLGTIQNPAPGSFIFPTAKGEEKKIRGIDNVFQFFRDSAEEFEALKKRNLTNHAATEKEDEADA